MDGCGKRALTGATFAGPRRRLRQAVAHPATAPPAASAGASASIAASLSEQKPAASPQRRAVSAPSATDISRSNDSIYLIITFQSQYVSL
jgi:hypothetical protein